MGQDKALLPFRGERLAQAVARAVAEAAGSVILVGNPEVYGRLGFPVIPDRYPGEGPLGGILTSLLHTDSDWNLLTACDMPEISAAFLRHLLEEAEDAGADALLPTGPSGRSEPLCAVYHRRCRAALEAAFAAGIRKVTQALEGVAIRRLPVAESVCFQNVNTPEDWAAYAR
jgi:molybdopterin-guanine dinucleotide biosynthesis protein A